MAWNLGASVVVNVGSDEFDPDILDILILLRVFGLNKRAHRIYILLSRGNRGVHYSDSLTNLRMGSQHIREHNIGDSSDDRTDILTELAKHDFESGSYAALARYAPKCILRSAPEFSGQPNPIVISSIKPKDVLIG
ncbi:hypothetical protein CIHG_06908 [Coccidioides immitis H538.4]|uniref:Uncharacterized protein n=3 Tax=Coccidioides immitis TaxID=5501 RepID=A0A0J8TX58_COCIT|nr:hypothetical protein CIRG_09954 [Coccidioides immitis RMSCC 2394]KMU78557.1 hypothetical protein CISG_07217 [Coccidioides immitis RMSCC 3703]KMU89238.1 hypothetical protein CIHG_06908 [Coccidioides immitis H538.4]